MSNKSIIIPVNNKPTKIENGLTTKLIDDYDSVLSAIFARLNKEDRAYVIDCKDKEKKVKRKPMFHK